MRAFFSLAILVGTGFLSISSLQAQVPGGDPDYVPPQIITTPRLIPPREAVDSGLGGTVRVKVSIDEAGNVTSADDGRGPGTVCQQVTRPDVVAMRNAAREAAMLAKFTPATLKGKPKASYTWLNFKFPGKGPEPTNFKAAPPPADGNRYTSKGGVNFGVAETPPAADGKRYTITRDSNTGVATSPPDYRGPVNAGGTGQQSDASTSNSSADPDVRTSGGVPKEIRGGVLNGKATSLPKPPYPAAARAVRAEGAVSIQVLIDENGDVFSAEAVSGHPLLRPASAQAACGSKFSPTHLAGYPVKVSGLIVYNFVR